MARSTGGGEEDQGYVITLATNIADYRSEAWIFNAQQITAGPIARVRLPGRVPAGFHALWLPGAKLWRTPAAA